MNFNRIIYGLIALVTALFFTLVEGMMIEEILAIGLFIYILLNFIDSIGKNYNILDIPILLALFQCMLMPSIVYHVYNTDLLVIALKYDMGVSAETYYGFMFPAIVAMIIGIKLPGLLRGSNQPKYIRAISEVRVYLKGKGSIGTLLIIIGVVSGIMKIFIPGALYYVAYLFSLLLYVGVLYTFFSDSKNRLWFLLGGGVFILVQAIAQGMFGELVYTLALTVLLLLLGQKIKTSLKFTLFITGFLFVLILQSVKADYRDIAWRGQAGGEQGNTRAFFTLIVDRLSEPGRFFDLTLMFPTVNRFNQGMIVGKVMDHIPNRAPFAEGETIFKSIAASFVPRIFWPDKPMSGGHENMERFTGYIIEGYSMNISPMGEAYGNYGVEGGIFFMIFYGMFFSVVIIILLNIIKKRPTLVLWFPILFLNSVQIETDILMCVNSIIKNLIFIWFCYWAADRFLRIKL